MTKKKQTRAETFDVQKQEQAVKAVQTLTVESAAKKVMDTQVVIAKTLGDVTAKLQEQLVEFEKVSQAVAAKQAELETLYGKEESLKNIDELEQTYAERHMVLDNEANRMAGERAQEEQSYKFDLAARRRNEEELFNEKMRQARQTERDRSEQLVKSWQAREDELKLREKELIDLRQQVADFPAKLDAEVKKAVAIESNSIKREFTHKAELQERDANTAKMVADNTIESLKERLVAADLAIASLTTRLQESDKKVENIANKALEAASSRQALTELQSVVQSQGNNSSMRKA